MKIPPRICFYHRAAFTLMELAIVILGLVVLGAVYGARMSRQKWAAARTKCTGNLKLTGLSFIVFANDHDDQFPFAVTNSLGFTNVTTAWHHFQAMSNECGSSKTLLCPADRERRDNLRSDFANGPTGLPSAGNAAVSYGIGLEADNRQPNLILLLDRNLITNVTNLRANLFLSGAGISPPEFDRQLHEFVGNGSLSDGSVQRLTNPGLANQVAQSVTASGLATNRLLLPLLP